MIIVYNEENPIYLAHKNEVEALRLPADICIIDGFSADDRNLILEKSLQEPLVILIDEPETLKNLFFSTFSPMEAAGGIVENDQEEILFIYRRDKWDLPKGKMEGNETQPEAAKREIAEETGIGHLTLIRKLISTYHLYNLHGEWILKTSHWFLFKTHSGQKMTPQTEEDITDIKWIHRENMETQLNNTYGNIRMVINAYLAGASD